MILTVDIGNTNTVCGVFREGTLVRHFRFRTEIGATADELRLLLTGFLGLEGLKLEEMEAIVVGSVVPPLLRVWQEMARASFAGRFLIARPQDLGLPVLLKNPQEVGVDRVLNALAAWEKYRHALIIVDYGTATTFDCVSERGEYLGGAIAPGLLVAAESLFQKASMLPRIELLTPPEGAIGKDTFSAMKSGLILGFAALTDGLVTRLAAEFSEKPRVIATGGLAPLMEKVCMTIERVEPHLTLEGLYRFYLRR
jgi:type III pantothenate kinase